jgi:capsular polysaccharide biosynthesis protein
VSSYLNGQGPVADDGLTAFANEEVTEVYTGALISLRTIKEALLRRWWLWGGAALLGLLIGAGFHLVVPTKDMAVTNLYLTEPASAGTTGMADDVSLFETNKVTDRALSYLGLPPTGPIPGSFTATALSGSILQVKADAPTKAEAVRWANALAKAFFVVRKAAFSSQNSLVIGVLNSQVDRLNTRIDALNGLISALSSGPAGPDTANEIGQLVNERSVDITQVSGLEAQVQQDLLQEALVGKGSYVLDPAAALPSSKKRVFAIDGLSGLVAGLAIGLGWVVIGSVLSERPRRRSDIAAAIGTSVELSLRPSVTPRARGRFALRRLASKPTPGLKTVLRRLRNHLAGGGSPLVIVPVGARDEAATCTVALATSLASEGKGVAVVDMAEGRPLGRLLGARKGPGTKDISVKGRGFRLVVAPEDPAELNATTISLGADAVLVLAGLDPATGAEHLAAWADKALVMVRAGRATSTRLEATGQMLRQAGVPAESAILFGVGREDETYGAFEPETSVAREPEHRPQATGREPAMTRTGARVQPPY